MQCGRALDRLLFKIHNAPEEEGPVHIIKMDLLDGFYRIGLDLDDAPKLGVVFPTTWGEQPLVAAPLVLPVGWTESPPHFCTATETITDLANAYQRTSWKPPVHPLEHLACNVMTEAA